MSASPMMKKMIMDVLKEELSLQVEDRSWDNGVAIQLILGGHVIGEEIVLKLGYEKDHRHGLDHLIGLSLDGE